jgi:hypothetical protein
LHRLAKAVTPTLSPAEADSETELAAASPSADRGNIELVAVGDGDVEALARGRAVLGGRGDFDLHRLGGLEVQAARIGDGDLAGLGIDREGVVRVLAERVGNAVRRAVVVARKGSHADAVTGFGVLCHRVGGGIAIADRGNVELVAVGDGDVEALRGARAVLGGRGDLDLHRLRGLEVQGVRIGDRDLTGLGVDRERVVRVLAERVGNAVRGAVVASLAKAVTPTLSPAASTFGDRVSAASPSLTAETSNSLLSVTAMSKLWLEVEPSSDVAVTSICIDWADSKSRPLRIGDGDLAGLGIDRERVVRVLGERVGDAVIGTVVVEAQRR